MPDRARDLTSDVLAELSELRSLARALVGAGADADDVVQATVAAALERPPARGGDVRSWLRGVARNLVRFMRRGERRRREREARAPLASAAALAADPADAAERVELLSMLVDEMRRLPEPYHSTLLLRYFEDLTPLEIAARQGVPAATARSWLKRGLERLRERLDERVDRRRWIAALLPWAFGVRPHAPIATRPPVAAPASGVLAVALVVGATWWQSGRASEDRADAPRTDREAVGVVASALTTESSRLAAPAPAADRESLRSFGRVGADAASDLVPAIAPATGASSGFTVRGRLVGLDDALPWTTRLHVTAVTDAPEHDRLLATADVDDAGAFAASLAAADLATPGLVGFAVEADDPRYLPCSRQIEPWGADGALPASATWNADLRVVRAAVVVGRVVDEAGRGLAGVAVQATPIALDRPLWCSRFDARSEPDGRFRLRAPSSGAHRIVALSFPSLHSAPEKSRCFARSLDASIGRRPAQRDVELEPGRDVDVGDLVLAAGCTIRGRVVDAQHRPIADAFVRADAVRVEGAAQDVEPIAPLAQTGDDGTFELHGLAARAYVVRVADHATAPLLPELTGATTARREVAAPAADVELVLPGIGVDVEVRTEDGPLAGACVTLGGASGTSAVSDAEGRASFYAPAERRLECRVRQSSFVPLSRVLYVGSSAPACETFVLEPLPPRPSLRLRVVDEAGAGIACASLLATPRGAPAECGVWLLPVVGSDGLLPVDELDAGAWTLEVHAGSRQPGGGCFVPERVDVELPRASELLVRVRAAGRLDLRALDPSGRGLAASATLRDAAGAALPCLWVWHARTWIASGKELWPDGLASPDRALVPGRYSIELAHPGLRAARIDFEVHGGETTTVEATLERA
jgi:RNA polymerase sigma-70 factor (ECF subfamily)